jgi:hypothetical protein
MSSLMLPESCGEVDGTSGCGRSAKTFRAVARPEWRLLREYSRALPMDLLAGIGTFDGFAQRRIELCSSLHASARRILPEHERQPEFSK